MKLINLYSIVIIYALVGINYNTMCQQISTNKEHSNFKEIFSTNGYFYGIHIKKCPGLISGSCIRVLYLICKENQKLTLKDFKNAEYNLKKDEFIVVYDDLFRNLIIQYSDLSVNLKSKYMGHSNKNIIFYNQLFEKKNTTKKRRKNKIYSIQLDNQKAMLFETSLNFLNEIYGNNIKIISEKKTVPVIVFIKE